MLSSSSVENGGGFSEPRWGLISRSCSFPGRKAEELRPFRDSGRRQVKVSLEEQPWDRVEVRERGTFLGNLDLSFFFLSRREHTRKITIDIKVCFVEQVFGCCLATFEDIWELWIHPLVPRTRCWVAGVLGNKNTCFIQGASAVFLSFWLWIKPFRRETNVLLLKRLNRLRVLPTEG